MDFSNTRTIFYTNTNPFFKREALELNALLKKMNSEELTSFMKISPKIAADTYENIQLFSKMQNRQKSALFAYSGTVYNYLSAEEYNREDLKFAENHLRILSGLYGILQPGDLVSQYRLEMKCPLKNNRGSNLYNFWKKRITDYLLNTEVLSDRKTPIINMASLEYFKAVDTARIPNPVISLHFKERQNGKIRTVGMYSKMARGMMACRIILEKITDPLLLQTGDKGGYYFDANLSCEQEWIFIRDN